MTDRPLAIAVVGSGVSGLTAAHLLSRRHRVTLYEQDGRLGGHAHTHRIAAGDGRVHGIDSGFIVHNERTYPNLLRLFGELGVATQESEMSFSVRCDGCGLEYAGARGFRGVFAQPRSFARPRFLRLLAEVRRFHVQARRVLASEDADTLTLGGFLDVGGYSRYFVDHFMLPFTAAVWSTSTDTARQYPARYLFRFFENHGMLSIWGAPTWRTVVGGSATYVERVAERLGEVRAATPVRAVRRTDSGVELTAGDGETRPYDGVVIATHPDQALGLLADPTRTERELLGAWRYERSDAILHTDASSLPRSPHARSSWNYRLDGCGAAAPLPRITYHLNRLQRIASDVDYCVSLNPATPVPDDRVIARMVYEHPIYTNASVAAQARLPEITTGATAYAGAYHGWGFHEDGCLSGVEAAAAFGCGWDTQVGGR